jgi:hypothetical protein
MLLHIIAPTFHRKERLLKMLGSVEEARKLLDCYSYVYVYYSDKEEFEKDTVGLKNYNIFTRLLDKPYKASQFWNDHIRKNNADVYVYINDDVELHPQCLSFVVNEMNTYYPDLDGVIGITQINAPIEQACHGAFGAIGSKFANRFPDRKAMCEDFYSFYFDNELYEYAKSVNKFHLSSNATLVHFHPSFTGLKPDETHHSNRIHLRDDKITNNRRRNKGLLWGRDFTLINA